MKKNQEYPFKHKTYHLINLNHTFMIIFMEIKI